MSWKTEETHKIKLFVMGVFNTEQKQMTWKIHFIPLSLEKVHINL